MIEMPITAHKLETQKLMARGRTDRTAAYNNAQSKYDTFVNLYFDPAQTTLKFYEVPSDQYVADAEAIAANSGDISDIARATILRDRLEYVAASNSTHKEWHQTKNELRDKLQSGEKITQRDVIAAEKLARSNSCVENLSLYSQINREHESPSPKDETVVVNRLTDKDVSEAYDRARRMSSPEAIARYMTVKGEFETQEASGNG